MNLKQMRVTAGFARQEDAAAAAGLDQTTISNLERGCIQDPRHHTLQALADAYKVDLPDVIRALTESIRESEAA